MTSLASYEMVFPDNIHCMLPHDYSGYPEYPAPVIWIAHDLKIHTPNKLEAAYHQSNRWALVTVAAVSKLAKLAV